MGAVHILAPGVASVKDLSYSNLASHRLRLAVAASACLANGNASVKVGDSINCAVDTLIVGKIGAFDLNARGPRWLRELAEVRASGGEIIIDYTDNHLTSLTPMTSFYQQALQLAHWIIVPSEGMKSSLPKGLQNSVTVIPDSLEYKIATPKQPRARVGVWFGHGSNASYLLDFFRKHSVAEYFDELIVCTDPSTLRAISNESAASRTPKIRPVEWSVSNQRIALLSADFAFLPLGIDDPRKSGAGTNRLMTSLCLGLPVFTHKISSYQPFADFFFDLSGNDWIERLERLSGAVESVRLAQRTVLPWFSAKVVAKQWTLRV